MEVIGFLAISSLLWLIWQLVRAKQFNRFKQRIEKELKPQVIEAIIAELDESRSELLPNNACHQQASLFYWTQYKSRILHAALTKGVIDKSWLSDTGNLRNAQHLFHIERQYLP